MKKNIGVIVAIVIVLVLAFVWWNSKNMSSGTTNTPAVKNTVQETNTVTETKKAGFTAADVAMHNSASDCYTIVGDKVYGLTDWISKHPGGEGAILGLCGKDGTQAFTQQHGSSQKAQSVLQSYLVGNLI